MILLNIEIPCDKYFTCSKVFCSKAKFTIVYYGKFSLGPSYHHEQDKSSDIEQKLPFGYRK